MLYRPNVRQARGAANKKRPAGRSQPGADTEFNVLNEKKSLVATVDVVAGTRFGATLTAIDHYGVVGALHIRASEAARIATANDHGYSKE